MRTTVTTAGEVRIWAMALGAVVRFVFQRSSIRWRFSGQVREPVIAERLAEEVGHEEARVALIGVAGEELGQRLRELLDPALDPIAGVRLPYGQVRHGRDGRPLGA